MMKTATLYKCGNSYTWAANYPDGGADLMKAAALSTEAQSKPTYHIRPAELTAERRADVDRSLEGYVRLNGRYRYQSGEQAYNGDKPIVRGERWRKKTLMQKVKEWFVEVVEE